MHADGLFLLNQFPLEILFDPAQSRLRSIKIDHTWNLDDREDGRKRLQQKFDEFESEKKYLCLKKEFDQHSKKIKILESMYHYDKMIVVMAMIVGYLDQTILM